jgi:hypothetical protein
MVITKRRVRRIRKPMLVIIASTFLETRFLPTASIPIKRRRPPSRAGKGRILRIARLTERIPIKLRRVRKPPFEASVVTA